MSLYLIRIFGRNEQDQATAVFLPHNVTGRLTHNVHEAHILNHHPAAILLAKSIANPIAPNADTHERVIATHFRNQIEEWKRVAGVAIAHVSVHLVRVSSDTSLNIAYVSDPQPEKPVEETE